MPYETVIIRGGLVAAYDPLTMNVDESKKPYWLAPFAATASQHFYGQTLKWDQTDGDNPPTSQDQDYLEKSGPFQAVIYVASKTHATYFRAGVFLTTLVIGGTANTGVQYNNPTGTFTSSGISNGNGLTFIPNSGELIALTQLPIVNTWGGLWGKIPKPNLLGVHLPTTFTAGPPSPIFRGPGEQSSSTIIIQRNPIGFHNAYLKSTQLQIFIP